MPANTSNSQQEANFLEDDDTVNNEEVNDPIIPESHEQDTSVHHNSPLDCQNQVELDTIPEEELEMEEQPDPADQDTLVFKSDESKEELRHPSQCHICCFESKDVPTQMTKQSFTIIYFITFKKTIHFKLICKNVHS